MDTWFDYRKAWAGHPWLLVYAIIAVAALVLAVIGTVERSPLAILFIPGLAALYYHHLQVMKRI